MSSLPSFTKKSSDNPSAIALVEREMLQNKMKVIVASSGVGGSDYYTSRSAEIEMSWLNGDSVGSMPDDAEYVWYANMPLPLWQCREVFVAAKKMPLAVVRDLIFSDYEMGAAEEDLFEVICSYGRAVGLCVVADRLYEGATDGDPRAIKMYLEVMALIGTEEEIDETKRMMRVKLDI